MAKRSVRTRLANRLQRARKQLFWRVRSRHRGPKQIAFVCGAAKSGKTLLSKALDQDVRVTLFPEDSSISGRGASRLRLRPPDEIAEVFERCVTPIIVAEAKVESHNMTALLDAFPGAKVIWVWRRFEGAVAGSLARFSSQRKNLLKLLAGAPDDWRAEGASASTRRIVQTLYSPNMPLADAAALFWYARNVLWFEQEFDRCPSALALNYEDFCRSPAVALSRVYELIGAPVPRIIPSWLHVEDIAMGADLSFQPEIRALCADLTDRFIRQEQPGASQAR